MLSYYKSVRLNGTDFHTGETRWAPPEGREAPWIVYHPSGRQEVPSTHPRDFLSVATVPTDCSGMAWPCRLLQVRPVEGHPVATPSRKLFPNRVVATAWEVVAELDPRLALGPQADQLLDLFDTAERLTGDNLRDLAAAWAAAWAAARNAARYAAWDAAWDAAWAAARDAAWAAARNAARYAAWAAARDAARTAARTAAGNAARDAARALVVRDRLAQEHYETLTRPWASVIGKVHPDDEDLRVNAAIEWSRWDEGGPTPRRRGRGLPGDRGMTGLPCIACGRTDPCPDCRHHNRIPGWDEPMLPLDEDQEED